MITYLKSAAMLFYKLSTNRYCLGLSNELLFVIVTQEAAKLWPVKVGGWIEIFVWAFSNPSSVSKSLDVLDFSLASNFDRSQFRSPLTWAMMMKGSSFESPKPYLLTLYLKNSIAALLTSFRMSWKKTNYYINGALLILN